jgi:hypothetical protein
MQTYETGSNALQQNSEVQAWLTKPGPTESFLRTAPKHLLQDNWESTQPIRIDPDYFTRVGPTPSFARSR